MYPVTSASLIGIHAHPVSIETDIRSGLPTFLIVGLPGAAIKESRDRIAAAIRKSQLPFPRGRITVNLAPAHIKKQGPLFDLPIAISVLLEQGVFNAQKLHGSVLFGELSLDGRVRGVQGALPIAIMAKASGFSTIYCPKDNLSEILPVEGLAIIGVESLKELTNHLCDTHLLEPESTNIHTPFLETDARVDLKEIKGQEQAKRGLEIAATGSHNLLLKGPPGTGKTMLAQAFCGLLPPLSLAESIEVTSIHSVCGHASNAQGLIQTRPFRSPHHSSSAASLVGGGTWPTPGEISLAHKGVLFLDELPEFPRHVLETLRQPMEDKRVIISRVALHVEFPADFILIATMNPCPCGFASDPNRECTCSSQAIARYSKRLSGPLIDRFDLIIEVPRIDGKTLISETLPPSTQHIQKRIKRAQAFKHRREQQTQEDFSPEAKQLLEKAVDAYKLSGRGFTRTSRVARTIADLEDSKQVLATHIAEALQYRMTFPV